MIREHHRKSYSLNNAAYIQAPERLNVLQAGNNSYYSILFAILGGLVTIVIVVFGFNYFKSKSDFEEHLKKQREESAKVDADLKNIIKVQDEKLTASYNQFDKAIAELLKNADENFKAIEAKDEDKKSYKDEFEELKKSIELIKNYSQNSHIPRSGSTKQFCNN